MKVLDKLNPSTLLLFSLRLSVVCKERYKWMVLFLPVLMWMAWGNYTYAQKPFDAADTIVGRPLWQPYYLTPRNGAQHLDLSENWQLGFLDKPIQRLQELAPTADWFNVAYPTSVHTALFKAGKLPDPYVNLNTTQYEWIVQKAWYYKKSFTVSKPANPAYIFLSFDGLDYFARVWLNGNLLGRHEGMFGGPEVEISAYLRFDEPNELVVELLAGNYFNKNEGLTNTVTNSFADNSGRVIRPWSLAGGFSHEMFYLMGMWNGARIDIVPTTHLERPFLTTTSLSETEATLTLRTELFNQLHSLQVELHPQQHRMLNDFPPINYDKNRQLVLQVNMSGGGAKPFTKQFPLAVFRGRNFIEKEFNLPNPARWNPNGLGEPNLYKVELLLLENGQVLDRLVFDSGIRTVEWQKSAGPVTNERWTNWQCVINGKRVFLRGTNWMPADMFLDLPKSKYAWALDMARDMGVQLIRVWGAGLQEPDVFYQLCNERGLLVWQDFTMNSASSNVWPQDIWEAQVLHTIFRIRNNPSLAVYCGGNETNPYSRANSQAIGILERNLAIFDPTRKFVRTTPDMGSIHAYPIYDPAWYRHNFPFVPFFGETGFFGTANAQTIREIIPASELNDFTRLAEPNYATTHPAIIQHYNSYSPINVKKVLSRASHVHDLANISLEDLAEGSQVGAAEFFQIMADATLGNYPVTTGIMTWVFKRPWPVFAANQLIDGMDRPLMAYYAVKRGYEPVHTALKLERLFWKAGEDFPLRIQVINHKTKPRSGLTLSIRVTDDQFKTLTQATKPIALQGGPSITEATLGTFPIPASYGVRYFFVVTELRDQSGKLITRSVYNPRTLAQMNEPAFYANYTAFNIPFNTNEYPVLEKGPWLKPTLQAAPQTQLALSSQRESMQKDVIRARVTNVGKTPSFMTALNVEGDQYVFYGTDNFFWLEPGESREIILRLHRREQVKPSGEPLTISLSAWNAPKTKTVVP